MAEEPLLRMEGICKSFHGVHALRGVRLDVRRGEVHSLVGENGAGKSTLMRILGGAVTLDEGTITLRGRGQVFRAPKDAEAAGVAMIHQELSLVPPMSVAENVFLGREPRTRLGFVDYAAMREHSEALLAELGTPCDVTRPAEAYSIATQQMVEVAKALGREADLIVMDEPTSALAEAEAERLFEVIRRLRGRGVSVVYISHKMEEIYAISDRVTVLRDGEWIGTAPVGELPQERLIEWMVGRKIEQLFPKHAAEPGAELLRVDGLCVDTADGSGRRAVDGASLTL
ncbi:MAG TPA: sugar ABC transporter ATP-binding protein, partial [Armatimonadota bacterium]|nr:sugar ABC transporter ATP-binding protein [Armatimonadota bacterium]